jgi:hypothetical protein
MPSSPGPDFDRSVPTLADPNITPLEPDSARSTATPPYCRLPDIAIPVRPHHLDTLNRPELKKKVIF